MNPAKFVNFSSEPFVGYWNGKAKTFKPGQSMYMEEGIARHFAKHLVNKVLISKGRDTATSPKFPEQVPEFMELFNQAFIPQDVDENDDLVGNDEVGMKVANLNKRANAEFSNQRTSLDHLPPQVVTGPDDDADDEFENDQSAK